MNENIVCRKAGPHAPDLWNAELRRGDNVLLHDSGLSKYKALDGLADRLRGLLYEAETLAIAAKGEATP